MEPTCALKALVGKYGRNVPRYTSYPTAAEFTGHVSKAHYDGWLAVLSPRAPVSLYVHVPFCDRLSWYCGAWMKKPTWRSSSRAQFATF